MSLAPDLELRLADAGDETFLRDLYAEMRAPELAAVPWSAAQRRAFCDEQFSLQDAYYREHYPTFTPLVILCDEVRIGRLYRAEIDGCLRLMDITIAEAWRGRGIGTYLVSAMVEEARRGAKPILLYVEPDNPARRLYVRLGFESVQLQGLYECMKRSA